MEFISAAEQERLITLRALYNRSEVKIMKVKVTKHKKSPAQIVTEQVSIEKIPENDFIKIIDALHQLVHNPVVRNAKAKVYPNLTINQYKEKFDL